MIFFPRLLLCFRLKAGAVLAHTLPTEDDIPPKPVHSFESMEEHHGKSLLVNQWGGLLPQYYVILEKV
jgi:hypothetical protein